MNKRIKMISFLLFIGLITSSSASAADNTGSVSVIDSGKSDLFDPENPDNLVDPGEGPSTTGPLRIDFVSTLNFGSENAGGKARKYNSLAQLFKDDTPARGYYIQVSDFREQDGWELQLKQNNQFKSAIVQNVGEQDLKGAVLSFDNGWANTNGTGEAPLVTRDAISIMAFDTAYTIATASSNEGKGSWTIAFGASENNQQNQANTLIPFKNSKGEEVTNEVYNKPLVKNSAITLSVPDETKIHPVEYETTLTWTLLAGPN